MSPKLLRLLDLAFVALHVGIILFNIFGWMWGPTRRAHLVVILATSFSWFVLGAVYGWGYCFLTDWHWQIRQKLGYGEMPHSFIKYAVDGFLGIDSNKVVVDWITAIVFFSVLAASIYTNFRD